MQIAHSLAELALLPQQPSVVTIGNFDGVHLGHQAVIAATRARAQALGARSVVVTFHPHPSHVLPSATPCPLLTPLPRKLELLAQTGVDLTLVLPFDDDLRTLTARQFAEQVLCHALRTAEIHEGETFRFGHQASGDITHLADLGHALGFTVHPYTPILRRGAPISSSRIRTLVAAGQLSQARALLGRPYSLDSTPATGRGYGTRYAVPTINLATPPALLPANGVYVTTLRIGTGPTAVTFQGVTNAGNRPTFGPDSYAIETHLFHFHPPNPIALTETTPLRLTLLHHLRPEHHFPTPQALKHQIQKDITQAQRLFHLCDLQTVPSKPHPSPLVAKDFRQTGERERFRRAVPAHVKFGNRQ